MMSMLGIQPMLRLGLSLRLGLKPKLGLRLTLRFGLRLNLEVKLRHTFTLTFPFAPFPQDPSAFVPQPPYGASAH